MPNRVAGILIAILIHLALLLRSRVGDTRPEKAEWA